MNFWFLRNVNWQHLSGLLLRERLLHLTCFSDLKIYSIFYRSKIAVVKEKAGTLSWILLLNFYLIWKKKKFQVIVVTCLLVWFVTGILGVCLKCSWTWMFWDMLYPSRVYNNEINDKSGDFEIFQKSCSSHYMLH